MNKVKLIPKNQSGNILNKLSDLFIKSAITENPTVASAAGWSIDSNSKKPILNINSKGAKQLRKNLPILGLGSIGALGVINPATTIKLFNHPITNTFFTVDGIRNATSKNGVLKTYNLAKKGDYWGATKSGVGDALDLWGGANLLKKFNNTVGVIDKGIIAKLRHPTYLKYYHGSPTPFNIKEAWMGTPNDIGLHMGNKNIATEMATNGGYVYEFYAPRPKLETIDNWNNDIELFTGNKKILGNQDMTFYATPLSKKWNNLLKKGDATFTKSSYNPNLFNVTIKKDINVPSKEINWPNMPKTVENSLNKIRQKRDNRILYLNDTYSIKYPKYPTMPPNMKYDEFKNSEEFLNYEKLSNIATLRNRRVNSLINDAKTKANSDAAKVLFDNGIDVVKYLNINPYEGLGTSYFLTNPSIIYQPKSYNIKGRDLLGVGVLGGEILNTDTHLNK